MDLLKKKEKNDDNQINENEFKESLKENKNNNEDELEEINTNKKE